MAYTIQARLLFFIFSLHGLLPVILADSQRVSASFTANTGQANGQPQPVQNAMPMEAQMYQSNAPYYRQDTPPAAVGYPPDQNYFFGAGFNKGFGIRVPDALSGAGYYNGNMHSPLGELWATKADLVPAIFKTGLVITVLIVIFKIVAFLVYAKKSALVGVGSTLAGSGIVGVAPVAPAVATGPVPVVSVLAERSRSGEDSSNKIKREASPVVDAQADFDAMLAQLDSIRSHFDEMNEE